MSTCPHCKGHLTESHQCPRRRRFVALEIAGSGLAGGVVGVVILAAFDPRGQITDMDAITFCVGALVGIGIDRFIRS